MSRELFRTVHGSRLYGLAHENSDQDLFVVTDSESIRSAHRMDGPVDTVTLGMHEFLRKVAGGSHQSCEALFSPYQEWTAAGAAWRPHLAGIVVGGADAFAKYERTIKKFSFGDFKKRRHAVRLAQNLGELRRSGQFNPAMTGIQIAEANDLATRLFDAELAQYLLPGVSLDDPDTAIRA